MNAASVSGEVLNAPAKPSGGRRRSWCGVRQAATLDESFMPFLLHTIEDAEDRQDLFDRLGRLDPTRAPLWGRMSAPRMVAHLCDQMRMPFNDDPSGPLPGPPRLPVLREAFLYFLPWPRGRVEGPPESATVGSLLLSTL